MWREHWPTSPSFRRFIFLVVEPYKNDRFIRFHSFQSIFFSVVVFGFRIVLMIVGLFWGFIHGFPGVDLGLAQLCSSTWVPCALVIFLMYKAYQNEKFHSCRSSATLAEQQARSSGSRRSGQHCRARQASGVCAFRYGIVSRRDGRAARCSRPLLPADARQNALPSAIPLDNFTQQAQFRWFRSRW